MRKFIGLAAVLIVAVVHYSIMGYYGYAPALEAQRVMVCAFSLMLALWCLQDAKEQRFHRPYEFGAFLFFVWPFVLPAYLIRTRGWRGVPIFLVFLFLAYLPGLCGWLCFYLGSTYAEYGG
jgi:hypothetical protein